MHFSSCSLIVICLASVSAAAPATTAASPTATDVADVDAAQATAKTESPTSHVKGKAFDRYVSIWFENTDYDMAAADPNFAFFAKKGITLENLFAITHPSEPNYMAVAGGDNFGLDGDIFTQVPENISTVVDLLEDKRISWAMYEEDMPYTGYQGFSWVNQNNGANDYPERLTKIKNTTMFFEDPKANKLPQWMFITPNMTSDGHDTSVTVAGEWLKGFLTPLLDDPRFMQNTLVIITFDESETYTIQIVFYDHYSEISTVEANWGLHTLGR
ncbi:Phosphate-repressible acid phosphatase [Hyphodiscus hymeniophilus]|uniref:Phosphate-repressible acid phosphatase n=1 Tax=Hyphodiscus hymeniophilus TaxID=353542 RepID=A0A9P7AW69_9HELO|nr:Phosphate-repressible acid phosphatase [Hyphodiscus hymeniophilus]